MFRSGVAVGCVFLFLAHRLRRPALAGAGAGRAHAARTERGVGRGSKERGTGRGLHVMKAVGEKYKAHASHARASRAEAGCAKASHAHAAGY